MLFVIEDPGQGIHENRPALLQRKRCVSPDLLWPFSGSTRTEEAFWSDVTMALTTSLLFRVRGLIAQRHRIHHANRIRLEFVLIREIRGGFAGHEFHEFHENDHSDLDSIALKYNFCQSFPGD